MSWKKELGEQIKTARLRVELSQEQLADKLSVSRVQLGNYEKGKSAIPVNILTEIADALEVESFTIAGYKIVPHEYAPKPVPAPSQQLPLAFGREQRFASASVNIVSTESDGVVITAVFKEPRIA
jgi:transcriptional regulator with XRE-family HTH domain